MIVRVCGGMTGPPWRDARGNLHNHLHRVARPSTALAPTHTESKPTCSPRRVMAMISGQRTNRSTSGSWKPTLSGRVGLGLFDLVGLDHVAFLEVLVALDP